MINLRDFFDAYDGAFRETATSIAQFYFEPCITARMGVPRLNATRTDTESFFGQVLEKYRAQGYNLYKRDERWQILLQTMHDS